MRFISNGVKVLRVIGTSVAELLAGSRKRRGERFSSKRYLPRLEALEDRTLPATLLWVAPVNGAKWSNPANWLGSGGNPVPLGATLVFGGQGGTNTDSVDDLTTGLANAPYRVILEVEKGYTKQITISENLDLLGGHLDSSATIKVGPGTDGLGTNMSIVKPQGGDPGDGVFTWSRGTIVTAPAAGGARARESSLVVQADATLTLSGPQGTTRGAPQLDGVLTVAPGGTLLHQTGYLLLGNILNGRVDNSGLAAVH